MEVLYLIPARGGSKGLPNKNIKKLGDKALINHAIDFARNFTLDENICLSSDSDEIIECALSNGLKVNFKRPEYLSNDTASTYEVILHAINFYESKGVYFDLLVLLQPTSPFRRKKDLENMLSDWNDDLDMMVSVKESHDSPYFNLFEEDSNFNLVKSKKSNFTRRQDCPKVYSFNGSLYLYNVHSLKTKNSNNFKRIQKYVIENPFYSIDIDDSFDWLIAETIIKNNLL
ncbi:acylneuraminate cytidylyltransferase family protein [Polaribacter vadi]|uniref:acylneuraminate cytidylyltransferase family protein n=1 Tax=Polaribacter vadi TaxID=1774273 RepID=UPI0030EC1A8A|tara:strand:+ start:12173 stop:12862 length:690 start_codon:yes stop_codon:yes gene_type:complete